MTSYSQMLDTLKDLSVTKNSTLEDLKSLCIEKDGNVEVYYCPFDHITPTAKVVLVGITPGKTQLINALLSFKQNFSENISDTEILKKVKQDGAFSGPLRKNLIELLDFIGLNKKLNIESTLSLFSNDSHLLHTTSVLHHPVFVNGKDYSGSSPKILKSPLMIKQIDTYLKQVTLQLPDAIYIPLGNKVAEVFNLFIEQGLLHQNQVLSGLPHPSGANAGRINYFLGKTKVEDLSPNTTVNHVDLDKAREDILNKINFLNI